MLPLPVPPVPDLARIEGSTVEEAVSWLTRYYEQDVIPWSYRTGTKCIRAGYRGLHRLPILLSGCQREKIVQARRSNEEVVELAAPLAFNRDTRVFDLPRRQFAFGRNLCSGYRIPFFFVENGTVKLYYLQPRRAANLTYDQLCMVATIHKRFLLDTEFFGLKCDVEYIDTSVDSLARDRVVKQYSLAKLELWDESRLIDRLTLIAEALEQVNVSGVAKPRRRVVLRPDPEMPLFD